MGKFINASEDMAYKLLRYEWKDNIEVDLNDVEL
jgi:hypothetical protein